ncbi:glycosyltransferase [Cellulomonas endophytica]|uniref:glycosyltransferase n=1 Tax=Cellulomonas endophytica TaxID=2494735 RepID=UPI00101130EF|nr:glycosyltransferase family 2 protein [Cellulomonas endophytica]
MDERVQARDAVTVVVPTFDEAGNIEELVRRIEAATAALDVEVLFVDDSRDRTPQVIERVAGESGVPVRLLHREIPSGGLGGAVLEGVRAARTDLVLVMDGDLQHPPAMIPVLTRTASESGADLVVASRYTGTGDPEGLANGIRRLVSSASTILTRAMFPAKLRACTDPMTGFFVLNRRQVDLDDLAPRGFKILLEIIARQPRRLHIVEEPFVFGHRFAGESKASLRQGLDFLGQLLALRFGKLSGFALVGALGAVLNVLLVAALTAGHVHHVPAQWLAAELTILLNFALQERLVFRDLARHARPRLRRFVASFTFNNVEALVRIAVVSVLVTHAGLHVAPTTAVALALAFLVRFAFHSLVVYAPRRRPAPTLPASVDRITRVQGVGAARDLSAR